MDRIHPQCDLQGGRRHQRPTAGSRGGRANVLVAGTAIYGAPNIDWQFPPFVVEKQQIGGQLCSIFPPPWSGSPSSLPACRNREQERPAAGVFRPVPVRGGGGRLADAIKMPSAPSPCAPYAANLTGGGPVPRVRPVQAGQEYRVRGGRPQGCGVIERSREYEGVYHVLHGVISPMNHVGRTTCTFNPGWSGWPPAALPRSSWQPTPTPRERLPPVPVPPF